jgi:hypothetical protein
LNNEEIIHVSVSFHPLLEMKMSEIFSEKIPNIMPFGHAANAIQLADGAIFTTWYCGSHEGSEDQRIAASIWKPDVGWHQPVDIVKRFDMDGETWIPEIGIPIQLPNGRFRLFFWACALSAFRISQNSGLIRISGGWGGGSWFPYPSVKYTIPIWSRDIASSKIFYIDLDGFNQIQKPVVVTEERGLVIMGSAHQLNNGRWILPYHTERKDCWFHSRFFVFDENFKSWEAKGDIHAEPGCLEPVVTQMPSGEVLCFMRYGAFDGHIWRATSIDEGETFSKPIQTNLRNPYSGIDIAVSKYSGRLLTVYNDSYRQRTPLCIGISENNGQTFRVRDIESGQGAFAYPKLLQDQSGNWHLFYTKDYSHIQHVIFNEEWLEAGRPVFG